MSKIAFISDIHGNYPALCSVLSDIEKQGISKIYCLGDLVGYYSQINEVIDTIRSRNIECLMGNHDFAMVYNKGVIPRSKTCTNVLSRQLEYITKENFEFISKLENALTITDDKHKIFAVHGGLNNYVDEYLDNVTDDYFSSLDDSYTHVITAHNHKPIVNRFSKIVYANSGSVGQPRDNDPRSSYTIFEDGEFSIVRVAYDINATIQQMKTDGFPDYIAEVLIRGCKIGG